MKHAVLLGDSIRSAYAPQVKELLADECEVWWPTENCAFAKWTLYSLRFWRDKLNEADVIHWNNGLHDVVRMFPGDGPFVSLGEYRDAIFKLGRELKKTGARVIFATTTPIGPKNEYQRSNQDIESYNRAALDILVPMGIEIDDLHALVMQNPGEMLSDDDTHPSEEGVRLLAHSVAGCIRKSIK